MTDIDNTDPKHDAPYAKSEHLVAPLSKNAQKRLVKAARRTAQKYERRAREKAHRRESKRLRKLEANDDVLRHKGPPPTTIPFDARVIIDLGFDELMTPKEYSSLCSQLNYTYSSQRKSLTPFSSLVFSSLGGRTKEHLESAGQGTYKRWKAVEWWEESYERIWTTAIESRCTGAEAKSKVVYLTADSDVEISELQTGETYIIGGIVDHNRYKNLCLDKARTQGIRTAKLPIGTYLAELKTRKVLTVNHSFDVLLGWVATRDWEDSIKRVMPKRKLRNRQDVEGTGDMFSVEQGPRGGTNSLESDVGVGSTRLLA